MNENEEKTVIKETPSESPAEAKEPEKAVEEAKSPANPPQNAKKKFSLKEFFPKYKWGLRFIFFSFLWVFVFFLAADLISKWAVELNYAAAPKQTTPTGGEGIAVIPNFFYIILSYNQGSAYSLGAGNSFMRYLFIVISWVASIGIAIWWYKYLGKKDRLVNFVFALALAGAVGNLIDRTFYWGQNGGPNGVIDWLSFYLIPNANYWWPFPTFNIADACLVIAVVMAIVIILVRDIKAYIAKNK